MHAAHAIVLKKIPSGEADALITLYTQEFGKLRVLAQGVRKERAKLKGHAEPCNYVLAHFVLGRANIRLTSVAALESWSGIRANLERRMRAHALLHAVDRACFERMRDERMWEFLCQTLAALERGGAIFAENDFVRGIEEKIAEIA